LKLWKKKEKKKKIKKTHKTLDTAICLIKICEMWFFDTLNLSTWSKKNFFFNGYNGRKYDTQILKGYEKNSPI